MEIATPVLPTARKIEAKIVSLNEDKASTPVSKQLITGVVEESNKLPNTKSSQDTAPVHTNSEVITAASKDLAFELWNDVLEKIKEAKHAVYGPLRLAQASLDGSVVRLGLSFPFHIKRVSETKNIDVVISTIKEVTHKDYSVEVYRIEQGEQAQATRPVKSTAHNNEEISTDDDSSLMSDPLSIVKNVFGGAQVL